MWMALVLSLSPWGPAATTVGAQRLDAHAQQEEQPALPPELEEAAAAFADGVQAYKEGRYEDAFERFGRAQQLAPHPDTLFNLGLAQQRTDRHVAAWRSFDALLAQAHDDQEREDILAAQAASRPHVAWVRVLPDPVGGRVCWDGKAMPTDAQGQHALLTTPGQHRLDVDRQHRTLKLEGGESRVVELVMAPAMPPPPPRRRLRVLAGLGIGGAAAAGGLGLGATFVEQDPARLGLGVGAAAAGTLALTSTVIALVVHRRAAKRWKPPAPLQRCSG
jgi:tetratricopeptide (TPR) repeat protein